MSFEWKKILATVAPGLATLAGGPLAGMATKAVCEVFGLGEDADEEAIASALSRMTPEQAIALKTREKEIDVELKKIGVDMYKAEVEDRKSAREREVRVGSTTITLLAFLVVGAFLGLVYGVLSGALSAADSTMAGLLLGYVSGKAEQVVSYFFGSSAGSAAKTEALAKKLAAGQAK